MSSLLVCFAFIFCHMLTFIHYIEVFSMFGLLNSVLFHTFFCNFGRAEENHSLYQGLHYVEVH